MTAEVITSTGNAAVKLLRSLKNAKARKQSGLFLVEGEKCLREAAAAGWKIEVLAQTQHCAAADIPAHNRIIVSEAVLRSIADAQTPQPMLAAVALPDAKTTVRGLCVALDGISDPGNVGAIIRSADAAGAACVALSPQCADPFAPKAVRSAMGSLFHLPVVRTEQLGEYLRAFAQSGVVVGADVAGGSEMPRATHLCVVIGNEAHGLSDEVKKLCAALYRLPMRGQAESLNAAVAAGIILYKAAGMI